MLVFRLYVEARTHLNKLVRLDDAVPIQIGGGIPVPDNSGNLMSSADILNQFDDGVFLRLRPGVFCLTRCIEAALIADAD